MWTDHLLHDSPEALLGGGVLGVGEVADDVREDVVEGITLGDRWEGRIINGSC